MPGKTLTFTVEVSKIVCLRCDATAPPKTRGTLGTLYGTLDFELPDGWAMIQLRRPTPGGGAQFEHRALCPACLEAMPPLPDPRSVSWAEPPNLEL